MSAFNGCKVFSASMWQQRASLDEEVTRWLEAMRQRPGFEVVDILVRQSSDEAFHCVSIVVTYNEQIAAPARQKAEESMPVNLRDMTPAQRKAHREFWLAWVARAQQALGALLAETVGETPAASDAVFEAVNQMIAAEQTLAAVLGQ